MKGLASRIVVGLLLELSTCLAAQAGVVDPELKAWLKTLGPNDVVPIIVTLPTKANLNAIRDRAKGVRRRKVIQALRQHADLMQGPVLTLLQNNSATRIKPLWIINGIAARVRARVIRTLARRPGVARVQLDSTLSAPGPSAAPSAAPEWNINLIHAPEVWDLGYTGQGIVVANMDTGVDKDHPDLSSRWRGGTNSWFDPHGEHPTTPIDVAGSASGHGTQTMGLMVAGEAGGTSVGAAPGAQWIAVKVFDDQGQAQESHFHQGFQWLLDPDGNPLTDDAPGVVNGSFQITGAGICDTRFETDIQVLKTASIAVVLAAGNSGPMAATSVSPANNPVGYGVGAVDDASNVANFSSRGPSACDGSLFPKLVAPGVNINTTDLLPALYRNVEGTSFAAPHVAGSMALLIGAFPNIAVSALETAFTDSATDLGTAGPDQDYGYGMLHVLHAHTQLSAAGQNPVAVEDSYTVDEDTALTTAAPGVLGNDTDPQDTDPQNNPLTAVLVTDVTHGTLTLDADGSFIYNPDPDYQGTDSFTYKARDEMLHESGAATVVITVNPLNDAPVASNDGPYTATAGVALDVPAPGLLQNDTDIDQDTLIAQGPGQMPAHGSVTVNSDGSFTYTGSPGYAGPDGFTYQACDLFDVCSTAAASIDVQAATNQPPVANPDAYSTNEDTALIVPASGVLGNDTDPDNPPQPLTAQWVAGPANGMLGLNSDGSFTYTPAANFNGPDSFTYQANDGQTSNNLSNVATVTLTVASVDDLPSFSSAAPPAGTVGQPYAYTATAADPDVTDTVSYSLVSGPAGMTMTGNVVSWTPAANQMGVRSFTVRATGTPGGGFTDQVNTVNVAVSSNSAPVAKNDLFLYRAKVLRTVNASGPLGLGVLLNDTDAENNPLTAQLVSGRLVGGGTLASNADGSFTYFRATASNNVRFRYRANDGALLSPLPGATVRLRVDMPPTTVSDNCAYDRSANTVTHPARCTVTGLRTVLMNVVANDTDPDATTNVPTDGVGRTVVPGSMLITAVGSGVDVLANPACGQRAQGRTPGTRATITNNCDGTMSVAMTATNTQPVVYRYRVSDDLGAKSGARQVTLNSVP